MISRREWLTVTLGGAAAALVTPLGRALASPAPTRMTVYRSPTCGCCKAWVDHATAGLPTYDVRTVEMEDLSEVKTRLGVPESLQSCHTAVAGPYVFEGHIPADVIRRFVAERPKALGLAVPGMPAGSPGMEVGSRKDRYDVILFDKAGKRRVYATR